MIVSIFERIKQNKLAFILVSILIWVIGENFIFTTAEGFNLGVLSTLSFFLLPIILLSLPKKGEHTFGVKFDFLYIFIILIFSCGLLNGSSIVGGSAKIISSIIISIIFVRSFTKKLFIQLFSDVIILTIIISIAGYVLISLHLIPYNYISSTGDAVVSYNLGCVYFNTQYVGIVTRNAGPFREPGIFMMYICLAFLFDMRYNAKEQSKRMIVYVLGIVSTFSTAGFIIFFILFIIRANDNNTSRKARALYVLLLIGMVFAFNNEYVYEMLFGKVQNSFDSYGSFDRLSSMIIPTIILKEHPIVGCGIENFVAEYASASKYLYGFELSSETSTNTILNMGAVFGIGVFIFFIVYLYIFISSFKYKKINNFLLFIVVIAIFSNEDVKFSILPYILITYGAVGGRYSIN